MKVGSLPGDEEVDEGAGPACGVAVVVTADDDDDVGARVVVLVVVVVDGDCGC